MNQKTIIEKSKEIELSKRINNYLYLLETIKGWELLLNMEENIIKNLMNDLDIKEYNKVRLTNESMLNNINFVELYNLFKNDTNNVIGSSLQLKIDIDKSLETLQYFHDQPQPVIKAFNEKLNNILRVEKQTLVVLENE